MRGRMIGGLMAGAALLLTACGGEAPEDGAATGGGEVLEGTASDAMLPLATVTSQPPLAPPEPEQRSSAPASTPAGGVTPSSSPTSAGGGETPASADEPTPG
ncbi:hypothetical protein [Croceibacterium ferulae]|uniref:hypothetical protein n=1 Tax=Croceibacterium ferulae TaxID=1854641 RepID=UPI000EB271EA|nr:hypothetical protein [Croceibacterium ferulae]